MEAATDKDQTYTGVANGIITTVLEKIGQKDWRLISDQNGTTLESKSYLNVCLMPCYRARRPKIQKSPTNLLGRVWNINKKIVMQDDPDVTDWEVLEEGKGWRIIWQKMKLPFPIWPRDIVYVQTMVDHGDSTYLVMYSTTHPKAPEDPTQFVRSQMHTNVFGFQKRGDGLTDGFKVTQIDPAGSIPTWVVNMFTGKLTGMLNKIADE
jgi:hypothetical protein